jgi:sulfonate transport system substrate-binding protein
MKKVVLAAVLGLVAGSAFAAEKVKLDYAYYSPTSLVLKEKGFLEESGLQPEWVLSLGSNKALEYLSGGTVDFGSSAGAAALLAKANGNPIKAVYIYSRPEWTALVTRDPKIRKIEDLKGKRIAVTRGTDPHIFLLRALRIAGLTQRDVKTVLLQHPDGKVALEKGDVDAWAGLDPHMAQTELEQGSRLFFRDTSLNTYGFLNVREAFAKENPGTVVKVIQAYEKARQWSLANPDELRAILVKATKVSDAVATKQLERNDLTKPVIGAEHREAIVAAGDVLKESGIIPAETNVAAVADALIDPQYVSRAVAAAK